MLSSFLNLLENKPADRVVWAADLAYWITGRQCAGDADSAWETEEGYLRLHRELGVMPYYYYPKFWSATPCYSEAVRFTSAREGNRTESRVQCAAGALTEVSTWLPTSCSSACTKHYVESPRDLRVLISVLEQRDLRPTNLEDYDERCALWRKSGGLPCLALPRSPLSAFIYEWAGVENAAYLLAECPEMVERALQTLGEQDVAIVDAVCRLNPPLVHFADNLSSDTLTPYYDSLMREHHAGRLDRLHAAGVKAAVHLDGAVRGLLPKLVDVGFDAIEALTPAPVGDMDAREMRRVAAGKPVILWGGVPGAMFAPPWGWTEMKAHVCQVLDAWRDGPFVLGVADQVPPDGDIDHCRRIADLLETA